MAAFREPQHIEMCPIGDFQRFLWVMEPTRGRIFGKAYGVTFTEIMAAEGTAAVKALFESKKLDAYNEMLARVGDDKFLVPEGSVWEAFL